MNYNQILYWKWDDSDFDNETYISKIDDIASRSAFDTLLVSFTWCNPKLNEKAGHDAIVAVADRLHSHDMKFLFDIDVRPVRSDFLSRYPNRRLGMVNAIEVDLDNTGHASGMAATSPSGDHYGEYCPANPRLLRAYTYSLGDGGYVTSSLTDITNLCSLDETASNQVEVRFDCGHEYAGKKALSFVVFDYSYPDIFCDELESFHQELLNMYADVHLDGVTIDEWGAFPQPNFDFAQAWRKPWYSESFANSYKAITGRDLILDFFNILLPPAGDPAAQLRAINGYYDVFRQRNIDIEQLFYDSVKRIWGPDAFVGVHPTWYAIDKVANTPEIWKNALDWWDVKRDYGQTDELVTYAVRTALAHKCGGAVFYNMWYGMGVTEASNFWAEAWENLRWGGRTHTLSYECKAETNVVLELAKPGLLESVSDIEELVALANLFQRTAVKSNVAVIMGYPAMVNWTLNVRDGKTWDMNSNVLCDGFRIAEDLFQDGWICDLIPSYEIYDKDLQIKDGNLTYGTESYDAVVFVQPEFSKTSTLQFLDDLTSSRLPLIILGNCRENWNGVDASDWFNKITAHADMSLSDVDSSSVINKLRELGIAQNDVRNGSRFQDGSVIICNQGPVHRGHSLTINGVLVDGHRVDAVCEDAFGIALGDDGGIERLFAGNLSEVRIDGQIALKSADPKDIYIERSPDGSYRAATVHKRTVAWENMVNLL
ncbi:MAG: hypothetical protein ABFD54_13480 [Armatimonadota bacterium]|nr:hypothetical protein [bacterium]